MNRKTASPMQAARGEREHDGTRRGWSAPQPIARLEFLRIFAPLAILGFLSSRFMHVAHWLTRVGFVVPERVTPDYRQPLYLPPIPEWLAIVVAITTIAAGLATSIGFRTRWSSGIFAALLAYLALADRLEAFTVNKLGTVVALLLFVSPAGARFSMDAKLRGSNESRVTPPTHVTWGNVRFFQLLVAFMYFASGIAKLKGGWLEEPNVIFSHLHDSYQTAVTYFLATTVPPAGLTFFQYVTLAYETGAPLWFGWQRTRRAALIVGLGMHASIGLMFGPVVWFSLLMMVLLLAAFAPLAWLTIPLERAFRESAEGNSSLHAEAVRG